MVVPSTMNTRFPRERGACDSLGTVASSSPAPAEAYAAARDRAARPRLAEFAGTLPFTLDGFQRAACSALEDVHGVLVCAPTRAGKTVVGEFAVHLALAQGLRCRSEEHTSE